CRARCGPWRTAAQLGFRDAGEFNSTADPNWRNCSNNPVRPAAKAGPSGQLLAKQAIGNDLWRRGEAARGSRPRGLTSERQPATALARCEINETVWRAIISSSSVPIT